jgi:hypothetical protein
VRSRQAGTDNHVALFHVEPSLRLHEVENPLLELIKRAGLHCMEEVRLQEVAHDTGTMSKHLESSGNMAQ